MKGSLLPLAFLLFFASSASCLAAEATLEDAGKFCRYQLATDQLTREANRLFEDPVSEARTEWIDPKILELQQLHFGVQGKAFGREYWRIMKSGVTCYD